MSYRGSTCRPSSIDNSATQILSAVLLFVFNSFFAIGWLGMTWLYVSLGPLRPMLMNYWLILLLILQDFQLRRSYGYWTLFQSDRLGNMYCICGIERVNNAGCLSFLPG